MHEFDSLGARQLPPAEPKQVATDWQDNPLFPGDTCYLTEDGYVRDEDIMEYVDEHLPKIELGGI